MGRAATTGLVSPPYRPNAFAAARSGLGLQGPTPRQQILARGWGYALLNTGSIQADSGEGLTLGIIGLVNKGQPRNADDWGVLRAWEADFGSSADKVFGSIDRNPYVAGEFVWSGWDYLGEPTPYSASRSSYFGIIDLAGFKKDRFYLYQAHWRPDLPMAHILPHWTWPDRVGQVTPVHVFTSGVEAELFLNGKSLGRKQRGEYEYRLRWDDVVYQPGVLKVVAYKNGKEWATDTVSTAAASAKLALTADRSKVRADGADLSFITVRVLDAAGITSPGANDHIKFTIDGPGEIVATDNGDPTSFEPFPGPARSAFNGRALVVVRTIAGKPGTIRISAQSGNLQGASVALQSLVTGNPISQN